MSFYRALTLNPGSSLVPSTQTNFPVCLTGIFSYLATVANGGKVQNASGFDIYFSSDIAGSNVIPFERVHWSATTGYCEFWILIASLGTGTTTIYLQYGNSSITTDQANPTGVWDSNYIGVYHFGDGTTLDVHDSTGNANNGTNHSGTAVNSGIGSNDGLFGGSASLGGGLALSSLSSAYVDLGNASSWNISAGLTVEYWFRSVSPVATFQFVITNLSNAPSSGFGALFHVGIDNFIALLNAGTETDTAGRTVTATQWNHCVAAYDGSTSKFYTDATLDATTTAGSQIGSSSNNCFIGKDPRTAGVNYLDGDLDEVRVSKVARSADYVTTCYNVQQSPSNFITVGTEQVGSTPINENLSDAFSFSDSEIIQLADAFAFADSQAGNWADLVQFTLSIPGIGLSDDFSGTWGDSVLLLMPFNLQISDTLTLTDGLNQPAKNMNAFIDVLSLGDAQSILVAVSLEFNDSFTWSDSIHIVNSLLVIESDSFTWSDLFGFDVPIGRTISDFFIWRDGQTVAWSSVLPPLTDSFSWSDSVTVSNVPFWTPVNETISDTLTLSDNCLINLAINIGISDTFSPSDNITTQVVIDPTHQLFQDSFNWSDGVLIIVEGELLQFADSFTFSDSVLVQNATSFNSYIRRYLNDEPA